MKLYCSRLYTRIFTDRKILTHSQLYFFGNITKRQYKLMSLLNTISLINNLI